MINELLATAVMWVKFTSDIATEKAQCKIDLVGVQEVSCDRVAT
jgi:hypothetical protein